MKYLLLVLISFPVLVFAEMQSIVPLGGVYYDNLNDLTFKVGAAYQYERVTKKEEIDGEDIEVWQHNNFVYSDAEVGDDYHLFTVGWGRFHFGSNTRFGLSYGEANDRTIYGLNGTLSLLFISFKAGIFKPQNESAEFMLGAGIGF